MDCKRNIDVSYPEPLSVYSTDGYSPIVRVDSGQLWYVASYFSVRVALALPVNLLYVLVKSMKIRNDELVTKSPRDQNNVRRDDSENKEKVLMIRTKEMVFSSYALKVSLFRFWISEDPA